MKKFTIILCLALIPMLMFGQERSINKFYNKYKNYDDVTSVKLSGFVLKIAAKFVDDEDPEAAELLTSITKLRVLVMENDNRLSPTDVKQLRRDVRNEQFEPLVTIKDDGTKVDFMVREDGDMITNVLILVSEADEFILLSLEGKIRYEDLQKLDFDIEGGEHFKKLPAKKEDIPRA